MQISGTGNKIKHYENIMGVNSKSIRKTASSRAGNSRAYKDEFLKSSSLKNNKNDFKIKLAAILTALGITTAGFTCAGKDNNKINTNEATSSIESSVEFVESNESLDTNDEIKKIEETVEISVPEVKNKQEEISEIFESHPEVKEQYDKINDALSRYSEQLGEDALPLIKERVQLLGNGRVKPIDVLKILWIESKGFIYDEDDPTKLLESDCGALGAFQLTDDAQDFLNRYFDLSETKDELDIRNPYDNLDACIYNLRFINSKRESDVEEGVKFPDNISLDEAVAWSYHDGPWAEDFSYYGELYVDSYRELSKLDDYPEVIDFILDGKNIKENEKSVVGNYLKSGCGID